jgi:hypothetical protein
MEKIINYLKKCHDFDVILVNNYITLLELWKINISYKIDEEKGFKDRGQERFLILNTLEYVKICKLKFKLDVVTLWNELVSYGMQIFIEVLPLLFYPKFIRLLNNNDDSSV